MPFIPTPNTARVFMNYSQNGQNTGNSFHVDVGAAPTVTDLNTIGAVFANWWDVSLKPLLQLGTSLQSVEVVDISVAGGAGIVYTTGLPSAGVNASNPMPNNVTLAIKLATGLTGRSHRGRSYVVGLPTNAMATGVQAVTPTFQGDIKDAYGDLINGVAAAGYTLVVTSFVSGGVPRLAGVNTEITSVEVNPTLDSQRRRLPERGS